MSAIINKQYTRVYNNKQQNKKTKLQGRSPQQQSLIIRAQARIMGLRGWGVGRGLPLSPLLCLIIIIK